MRVQFQRDFGTICAEMAGLLRYAWLPDACIHSSPQYDRAEREEEESVLHAKGYAMSLEREIETYRRKLPELLANAGKFVVIHGDEIAGTFDTHADALAVGYDRYGDRPFLVRQIRETEPVLISTRSLRPCLTPPAPSGPTEQ